MERKIIFNQYRNLGIDKPEEFLLTPDGKGSWGELIVVIGGNNVGKSNVLDGILALEKGLDADRDKPDFVYEETKPHIKLILSSEKKSWSYVVRPGGIVNAYDNNSNTADKPKYTMSKEMGEFLDAAAQPTAKQKIQQQKPITGQERQHIEAYLKSNHNYHYNYGHYRIDETSRTKLSKEFNSYLKIIARDEVKENNQKVLDEIGIPLIPDIIEYKEKPFSQKDMMTPISNIKKSAFFAKIFNVMDVKIDYVERCYEQFDKSNNRAHIGNLNTEMNKKLEIITKQFNKMYAFDDNEYKFEITFESDKVFFAITYSNGTPLNIDRQSTGFKWFFNFYINTLNEKDLGSGDIVIMDEPATNLHVRGMVELRNFLKEYAQKSGITFILSTHSPFLIDADYLDEIRIVKKEEEKAKIINQFTLTSVKDSRDTLFDIIGSLTVGRHIVLDPNNPLIFVEGITDYNYLVAFKKYFEKDDLRFLPVKGIKDKKLIEKLLAIKKDPILLVDGDEAGKIAVEQNGKKRNKVNIVKLNEIVGLESAKTIEDLFTGKDKELVEDKNKSYKSSCAFKKNFANIVKELSQETIDKFRILIDYLELV